MNKISSNSVLPGIGILTSSQLFQLLFLQVNNFGYRYEGGSDCAIRDKRALGTVYKTGIAKVDYREWD